MTLIENKDHMLVIDLVFIVLLNEDIQFLDGRDDDLVVLITPMLVLVFQLPLQDRRRGIAVGRAFFKTVVFFHGLVV